MKIRVDKADRLFSLFIRNRDKWTCQRCGKKYPEGSQGLHNSHFWGRGREATRYCDENCDAICFGCHQYFGSHPAEYTEWKKKRLGQKRYDALMLKANTYCKKDRKLMAFIITKKLEMQKDEKQNKIKSDMSGNYAVFTSGKDQMKRDGVELLNLRAKKWVKKTMVKLEPRLLKILEEENVV